MGTLPRASSGKTKNPSEILKMAGQSVCCAARFACAPGYQTPDEDYFATCNPRSKGYYKTEAFTPIF